MLTSSRVLQRHYGAHGVVVSHPLRMRKALGSNPSVSIWAECCRGVLKHSPLPAPPLPAHALLAGWQLGRHSQGRSRLAGVKQMLRSSGHRRFHSCRRRRFHRCRPASAPASCHSHGLSLHLTRTFYAQNKSCAAKTLWGTWCSGITSAPHAEGPGFKSQCVHVSRMLQRRPQAQPPIPAPPPSPPMHS